MTSRTTPTTAPAHTAPVPAGDHRDAISLLPGGVSVVTAVQPDGPAGCTVNAFMSLSLDPPSLLISLNTGSRALSAVREAGIFALYVLAWPDRHLAQRFAAAEPHRSFQDVPWSATHGAPVLTGSTLSAVCEVNETVPLLDHTVVAGTVVRLRP